MPEELRGRIAAAAAGNPLFISEMLAMTQEAGDHVEVPASLKALLAARLDQLDPAERRVLECGSVEGEVFHRSAVQALTPEETQVTPRLAALAPRELIRSERPQLAGEDGFRFRHLLIRDTAYDALPKTTRAELHQRFAAWLEQHGQQLVELDEIVGNHLEQAARYLGELGKDSRPLALAVPVTGWGPQATALSGGATGARQSGCSSVRLALTRPYQLDLHLEAELVEALYSTDVMRAVAVADAASERAVAAGDDLDAAFARTVAALPRLQTGQCSADELERLAREDAAAARSGGETTMVSSTSGTRSAGPQQHAPTIRRTGRKRRRR